MQAFISHSELFVEVQTLQYLNNNAKNWSKFKLLKCKTL